MLKIVITDFAKLDIDEISEYTRLRWGVRQEVTVNRLLANSFKLIAAHPRAGHHTRLLGTYTRVVARLPFVITYEINNDAVIITQIIHQSRQRK